MAQGLTYTDAVKLLGGAGPLGKAADNLAGAALLLGTAGGSEIAISLFDAKGEASRLGFQVAEKITDWVRGQGRYKRSERLHAAHAVLVVTSFFHALGECLESAGVRSPEFTREDQLLLVATARTEGSWQSRLLDAAIPGPSPDVTFDQLLETLAQWYAVFAGTLTRHLPGLAVWDAADDRAHRAVEALLTGALPELARDHYEEVTRRLSADVPEFAIWMTRTEDRAASRGMERLEAMLLRVTSQPEPAARHRAGLAAVYRAKLDDPVLSGKAGDLTMPSLGEAYMDARFRAKAGGPGTRPADDGWWDEAEARDDFDTFLATHLTTPQAATAPLLLLGQPGGGKSSLTKVLAARLPAADYLVVRVELREVRAESSVQDQIEQALRGDIGETVNWAELAASADGAMPVVLLDGLDELLQATGVHQSDYLERVAQFQQREARLGRPAAVVVTSRVAVADRARVPSGGIVVRLEPFDEPQVDRWLAIWNDANSGYWARSGRRPLTREMVLRFPDLATQPLLLLMLALYDAGANALQDADDIDTGELYERLLHDFAEREVRRVHGPNLTENDRADLIDEELLRLSVVAFAMFHRLRLWVTTGELDADLTGLDLKPSGKGQTEEFRRTFNAGEEMVGRFFFIQRLQAVQDDQTLQTYEFLHATFGEYLVARLVVQAVREATELSKVRSIRVRRREDDDLVRSLLGYTPLCARSTVLPFVTALLARYGSADVREWVVEQLRVAVTRPTWKELAYRPVDKRIDHWMATYSFNLLLIALACGRPVRASELFLHARDPAGWLRDSALQWRGSVPGGMFLDGLSSIQVTRTWAEDERRDMVLEFVANPSIGNVDPRWSHSFGPSWSLGETFPVVPAHTSMELSGAFSDDVLRHVTEPVREALSWRAMNTFLDYGEGRVKSLANSILEIGLMERPAVGLVPAYERVLHVLRQGIIDRLPVADYMRCRSVVLEMLAADAYRLPSAEVRRLAEMGGAYMVQVPLVLECLARGRTRPDAEYDEAAADWADDLANRPDDLTPEICLRLITVLPAVGSWRLEGLLKAIANCVEDSDVSMDADAMTRFETAWARFEGYRDA